MTKRFWKTPTRVLSVLALGAMSSLFTAPASADERIAEQSSLLEPALQNFIASGNIYNYLPERQLQHEAATRDPEQFAQLVADVLAVAQEMGYDATRDMGAMPLNTNSRLFNANTITTPPPLRKVKRDPGPFSVHRYLFPESGVPTFAGAPVAIWPEDLIAGAVDVAIIGIPNDMGSGRRNAEHGPMVMRALNTIGTIDTQSLVNPMEALSVVDYGDFAINNLSTERTVNHVQSMVAETAATGAIPMMVGGDTSMLYPGVKGVAGHQGEKSFGLLHLSAHPDVERDAVHTISDRQAVYLLLKEGVVQGEDTIQVGLRGPGVDEDTLRWLRSQKVKYHTMAEIDRRGFDTVLARVLREVKKGPDKLFVSIDVSVVEPTQMSAAGRVTAHGLGVQQLSQTIRHVCAAKEIVGFEITDMAPMLDNSRVSTLNANTLLNACLVGVAVREAGHDPDWVHPLAASHGQR